MPCRGRGLYLPFEPREPQRDSEQRRDEVDGEADDDHYPGFVRITDEGNGEKSQRDHASDDGDEPCAQLRRRHHESSGSHDTCTRRLRIDVIMASLPAPTATQDAGPPTHRLTAVILDLDDTIVDTYELLIVPLETEAAHRIASLPGIDARAEDVLAAVLDWRGRAPDEIDRELSRRFPAHSTAITAIRREAFATASPDRLRLPAGRLDTLRDLKKRHLLVLLTEGDLAWQQRKVAHLGLTPYFDELLFVDPASGQSKHQALADLGRRTGIAYDRMVVVGNRSDNEIAAGTRLGTKTIWVRVGEGRHRPPPAGVEPHAITDSLAGITAVVEQLLRPPAS